MDISTLYPSKYLAAGDLPGPVRVTILELKQEMVGIGSDAELKPILSFANKSKMLILNKTNLRVIGDQYGKESTAWAGKDIVLKPTMVDYKGKMVPAIRVDAHTAPRPVSPPEPRRGDFTAAPPAPPASLPPPDDDSIPC